MHYSSLIGAPYRLEPFDAGSTNCDASGLRIAPIPLLRRTFFGFEPRPLGETDFC